MILSEYGDNKASEVVIDEGVRIIDVDVFREFSSLKRVSIADTVTQISKSAFCDCENLEEVKMSKGLLYIDSFAFQYCSALRKADLYEGVKRIDMYAFDMCDNLKTLSIPNSIIKIVDDALSTYELTYYKWENGLYLGNKDNNYVVFVRMEDKEASVLKIHENTKVIYKRACEKCENLKEVYIPDGVT